MSKICLDAGHYGKYNRSPANGAYYESDMVWKLHLLQKKYLEQYGFEVILTRNDQGTDKALYDRGAMSEGCVLFLSDHSNAVGSGVNESIDYPVAYTAVNGSADAIAMLLTECVEEVMGTNQKARIEHRRGSNGDYYGVVRGATAVGTPGLILEHSFHTNTRMTNWLLNDDNLDKLARAEAAVIAEYFGMAKTEPKAYYTDAVAWAMKKDITTADDMAGFEPDRACTRAQAITFIWRMLGNPKPRITVNPFTDVLPHKYYYKAILWAYENGITTGKTETEFQPDAPITREQFVTFLWRAEGSPAPGIANPFVDVPDERYSASAILWAYEKGITKGKTAITFEPIIDCTRGQVVTFLYRNK